MGGRHRYQALEDPEVVQKWMRERNGVKPPFKWNVLDYKIFDLCENEEEKHELMIKLMNVDNLGNVHSVVTSSCDYLLQVATIIRKCEATYNTHGHNAAFIAAVRKEIVCLI